MESLTADLLATIRKINHRSGLLWLRPNYPDDIGVAQSRLARLAEKFERLEREEREKILTTLNQLGALLEEQNESWDDPGEEASATPPHLRLNSPI